MIVHQGIYLPDGETHLVDWMTRAGEIVDGKGSYQIKKFRAAMANCPKRRTAVDCGAHVGMWTVQMAKLFDHVIAFEPVAAHRECWEMNLVGVLNAELRPFALGEHAGSVRIETAPTSSGDSRVAGPGDIPMVTLDSLELDDVDFVKIDTEGHELFVLKGAEQTIARSMPTLIVEQKKGRAQRYGLPERGAVDWLINTFHYQLVAEMSGDFIMVPPSP